MYGNGHYNQRPPGGGYDGYHGPPRPPPGYGGEQQFIMYPPGMYPPGMFPPGVPRGPPPRGPPPGYNGPPPPGVPPPMHHGQRGPPRGPPPGYHRPPRGPPQNGEESSAPIDPRQRMLLPAEMCRKVAAGDVGAVKDWLMRGGHIDAHAPEDGWLNATMLTAAAFNGQEQIVRELLYFNAAKVSLDETDTHGCAETPPRRRRAPPQRPPAAAATAQPPAHRRSPLSLLSSSAGARRSSGRARAATTPSPSCSSTTELPSTCKTPRAARP